MELGYNKIRDDNDCVKIALYVNNYKIDESEIIESEIDDGKLILGQSGIELLFVKHGILYYIKPDNGEYNYYTYNPRSKKIKLYKPELFYKKRNNLLGILDNGDVVFSNSVEYFSCSESIYARAQFVVPKSMPRILAIQESQK